MNIGDSTNITGISRLIDYSGDKNLAELERGIIDDTASVTEIDDVDRYKKQLEDLGSALGVTLDDDDDDGDSDDGDGDGDDGGDDTYGYSGGMVSSAPRSYSQARPLDAYNPHPQHTTRPRSNMYNQHANHNTTQRSNMYTPRPNTYMEHITEEQKKQNILNHVLSGVENQKFSVEKEKEEDDKAILLEQIDMLITNLKDEGIDVSRVPDVNNTSPIEDIENVHKILRLKNDRNRYCSFAEECILAGSHTLEWLFDGRKTYLGKSPDLRGWSATVNIKLRRMRFDTSTFVSGVMQDYNLGHGTRILFELIPSLFLYSKMKKSQYADNLITSDEMNSAIDRIRDIEDR